MLKCTRRAFCVCVGWPNGHFQKKCAQRSLYSHHGINWKQSYATVTMRPRPTSSPITGQSTNYTNWEPNYFCLPHAPPRIIHQCPFPTLCSLLLSCTKFQRLISLTNSVFQVPRFFLIKTNYYNFILIIFIKSTVCKTYNIFGKNCLLASTALL